MAWRVAESLLELRQQIDSKWPGRSRVADGTIGDAQHASRTSDHNPWVKDGATGIVTALDITHDPAHGVDAQKIVDALVTSRDKRIKYLIHNGRMWRSYDKPGIPAWTPAPYTGSSPHEHHFHLSVQPVPALYDSGDPWRITERTHLAPIRPEDWKWARWYLGIGEYSRYGRRAAGKRPPYPRIIPIRGWRAVHWYKMRLS